jgi:hypothetical protein
MKKNRPDLDYYANHGSLSSPGPYAAYLDDLPTSVPELCSIIQGLIIHAFWISEDNYGVSVDSLKKERQLTQEYNLRSIDEMLAAILNLDKRPLYEKRAADKRLVGNCRDFALMLTAFLRHQHMPARVRSGVARYFYTNGQLEDHFITEWWNAEKGIWQYTDPQIDDLMAEKCGIQLDVNNLPRDQFLHAGLAYQELISDKVKPENIGIFDFRGLPYVRYKLVSDLACLNKYEILAWEGWGIVDDIGEPQLSPKDQLLLDRIAGLLNTYDEDAGVFPEITDLFRSHPRLQFPQDYQPHRMEIPQFA